MLLLPSIILFVIQDNLSLKKKVNDLKLTVNLNSEVLGKEEKKKREL